MSSSTKASELTFSLDEIKRIHEEVEQSYQKLVHHTSFFLSPMSVSELLLLIKQLRQSIEIFLDLPTLTQEKEAWLLINTIKLLIQYSQPLLWFDCGKYIIETIVFTLLSMETVINLCTIRHLPLRFKLTITVFYAILSQNRLDEGENILRHLIKEVDNLWEREQLDPPVPMNTITQIQNSQEDLTVLRYLLDHFRDPDRLDFTMTRLTSYRPYPDYTGSIGGGGRGYLLLSDRCLIEFIRVHLINAGNQNEAYIKRSQCLLKAANAYLQPPSSSTTTTTTTTATATNLPSIEAAFEVAYFLINDGFLYDDENNKVILSSIWTSLTQHKDVWISSLQTEDTLSPVHREYLDKLIIVIEGHEVIQLPFDLEVSDNNKRLIDFMYSVQTLLFTESSHRSRSMLSFIAIEVFRKVIYTPIQLLLSTQGPSLSKLDALNPLSETLQVVLQALDGATYYDPVFYISVSILLGNLLYSQGEYRQAVAMMQSVLTTIDEIRNFRVDFLVHSPEDVRDIIALQHASISCQPTIFDWYDSRKRLGAFAFAGFGLFGLCHAAHDTIDRAISELHIDVIALYFRCELAYYKEHFTMKQAHKKVRAASPTHDTQTISAKSNNSVSTKKRAKVGKGTATLRTSTSAKLNASSMLEGSDTSAGEDGDQIKAQSLASQSLYKPVESWPIVLQLLRYCKRNHYLLAVLYLEMAKMEVAPLQEEAEGAGTDYVDKYLQLALANIQEAEASEHRLCQSFQEVLMKTNNHFRSPFLLSRSSRYVYLLPVQCNNLKDVQYYKIYGKEKGSGTDVSIYNNILPGCEVSISAIDSKRLFPVKEAFDLSSSIKQDPHAIHRLLLDHVVRLGPLVAGEEYIFASAAFNSKNEIINHRLSPSTPVIETVHPLNTSILSLLLVQMYKEKYGIDGSSSRKRRGRIEKIFLSQVARDSLLSVPPNEGFTLTNAFNLFPVESFPLDYHHLSLTSVYHQKSFLKSYLHYLSSLFQSGGMGTSYTINQTKENEKRLLTILVHLENIFELIQSIGTNYPLLIAASHLFYNLLQDWGRFHLLPLASYAQSFLMRMVIVLQLTDREKWPASLHKVYICAMAWLIVLSARTGNMQSVLPLFEKLYPMGADAVAKIPFTEEICDHLYALYQIVDRKVVANTPQKGQLLELVKVVLNVVAKSVSLASNDPTASPFWTQHGLYRTTFLIGQEEDIGALEGAPNQQSILSAIFDQLPKSYSDYLSVVVNVLKALKYKDKSADMIRSVVTSKLPIVIDYLAKDIAEMLEKYNSRSFCISAKDFLVLKTSLLSAAVASGGKDSKGKGKDPKKDLPPAVAVDNIEPPNPYSTESVTEEETRLQAQYLAEIISLLTPNYPDTKVFVPAKQGPLHKVDSNLFKKQSAAASTIQSPSSLTVQEATNDEDKERMRGNEHPIDNADGLSQAIAAILSSNMRNLGTSFLLCARAQRYHQAHNLLIEAFNHLQSHYVKAELFYKTFPDLVGLLYEVYLALLNMAEDMLGANNPLTTAVAIQGKDGMVMANTAAFDVNDRTSYLLTADTFLQSSAAFSIDQLPVYHLREIQDKLLRIADIAAYWLQVLYLAQNVDYNLVIVPRMLRFLYLYGVFCRQEVQPLADLFMPYLKDMQEMIIYHYDVIHKKSQGNLQDFIRLYEEAQAKQRKKKLKINRLEKDDEELAFEAQKMHLESIIAQDDLVLNQKKNELTNLLTIHQAINQSVNKHQVMLVKIRHHLHALYSWLNSERDPSFGNVPVLKSMNTSNTMSSSVSADVQSLPGLIEKVKKDYTKAIHILRENKERLLLMYALNDISELMIRLKDFEALEVYIQDSIDGFFSVYNAIENHRAITHGKTRLCENEYDLGGIFYLLMACGRGIYYCYQSNRQHRISYRRASQYALMAGEMTKFIFQDSLTHPSTFLGFAQYQCKELYSSTILQRYEVNVYSLYQSVTICIKILLDYLDQPLYALPLIVFNEYLAVTALHSMRCFYESRSYRIQALISLQLFAEAISMLSQLPKSLLLIHCHRYHDDWNQSAKDRFSEIESHGLSFENCPSFVNSQLPVPPPAASPADAKPGKASKDAPPPVTNANGPVNTNAGALEWVLNFPTTFQDFLTTNKEVFMTKIPMEKLSEEQKSQMEKTMQAAQEAATLAAANAKGGKGKGKDATAATVTINPQDYLPEMRVIDQRDIARLYYLCSALLYRLASMTSSLYSPSYRDNISRYGSHCQALLSKVKTLLYEIKEDQLINTDSYIDVLLFSNGGQKKQDGKDYLSSVESPFVRCLFTQPTILDLYHKAIYLEEQIELEKRDYRKCLSMLTDSIKVFLHPSMNANLSWEKHFVLTRTYFLYQLEVVHIFFQQNKYYDVIALCRKINKECEAISSFLPQAACYFYLSLSFLSLGKMEEAGIEINNCVLLLQSNHIENSLLIQAKAIKAKILIVSCQYSFTLKANLSPNGDVKHDMIRHFFLAYLELKDNLYLAEKVSGLHGVLRPDSNLILHHHEEVKKSMERENSIFTPLQYLFTEFHTWEPHPHRYEHHFHLSSSGTTLGTGESPSRVGGENKRKAKHAVIEDSTSQHKDLWCVSQSTGLRIGPVDWQENFLFESSNVINVYQPYARLYLISHVQLLMYLQFLHSSQLYIVMQNYAEDLTEIYQELQKIHSNNHNQYNFSLLSSTCMDGEEGRRKKYLINTRYVDTIYTVLEQSGLQLVNFHEDKLIQDMVIMAEQTLKLMREVVYMPSYLRLQALSSVGKARTEHALYTLRKHQNRQLQQQQQGLSVNASATSLLTAPETLNGAGGGGLGRKVLPSVPMDILFAPLLATLYFASQPPSGSYQYLLLRDVCLNIANTLAEPELQFSHAANKTNVTEVDNIFDAWTESAQRSKAVIFYLMQAIKFHNIHLTVYSQLVTLPETAIASGSNSSSAAALERILIACYNSSISGNKLSDGSEPVVVEPVATEKGAKGGKAAPKDNKGAANTTTPTSPPFSSRDVLLLLTSTVRQCDDLFTLSTHPRSFYNMEHSLANDLHILLTEVDSNYRGNLTTTSLPNSAQASLVVPVNTISTIWAIKPTVKEAGQDYNLHPWGIFNEAEGIFVMGDVLFTPPTPTAPVKGKAPAAPGAVDPSTPSSEPALKKVRTSRAQLKSIETMLRNLQTDYQQISITMTSPTAGSTVAAGSSINDLVIQRYAQAIRAVYMLVRYGEEVKSDLSIEETMQAVSTKSSSISAGDASLEYKTEEDNSWYQYLSADKKLQIQVDKASMTVSPSEKQLGILADIFNPDRCAENAGDAEVCHLLRLALGCAKFVKANSIPPTIVK